MLTVTIEEAQAKLVDLIHTLQSNEEVVITEHNQPIARLMAIKPSQPVRELGTLSGTVLYMAPDFDTLLADFKEYME